MPGQKRPAGELDGSPLSGGGVNVRSCVGAARKYCGLCRNGFRRSEGYNDECSDQHGNAYCDER
jgi:hypothetical protein